MWRAIGFRTTKTDKLLPPLPSRRAAASPSGARSPARTALVRSLPSTALSPAAPSPACSSAIIRHSPPAVWARCCRSNFNNQAYKSGFRRERSCLPQIPGAHQDAGIGRGRLGRFLVVQKDNLALAELQRLGFKPGIDLGIDRAKDSFLEGGGDDDIAMAAHQRDRRGPECAGQCRTEFGRADQHIGGGAARLTNLEHWRPAPQERAQMKYRPKFYAGHPERDHRRGMAVHDRLDLGLGLIDLAVDKSFEIDGTALRIDRIAVAVEFHDVGGGDQAGRHAARQQEMLGGFVVK